MLNANSYSRIIIYQFGKCGSTSLYDLFKSFVGTKNNVLHTHHDDFISKNIHSTKQKELIITVTRNIFDRNISSFFQNITNEGHFWYMGSAENIKKLQMNKIMESYIKKNITHSEVVLKNWYSNFNKKLDIDVFAKKFNFADKYVIYETPKYTILVLRYEDIKQWDFILPKIFSNKFPKLPTSNVTSEKNIGNIYSLFKKTYKVSQQEANIIKNIDVMTHFYKKKEIDDSIAKYA